MTTRVALLLLISLASTAVPARAFTLSDGLLRLTSSITGAGALADEPERPKWPAQYQVSWNFLVPYVSKLQSTPLVYNYTVFQDTEHGRQKIVRDSVETTVSIVSKNVMYEMYPVVDKMKCDKHKMSDGPEDQSQDLPETRKLLQSSNAGPKLGFVLPDLSENRWKYNGTAQMHKQEANTWVMHTNKEMGYGDVISTYTMYVAKDGTPLQFYMHGVDLYMQSHFDDWIVDIVTWRPGPIDEGEWRVPYFCHQAEATELAQRHRLDSSLAMEVAKQLPNPHFGDKLYDAFVHRHGRRHTTRDEYDQRAQMFHKNRQMIENHNSQPDKTHTLALNRFADWHKDEFLATLLPNHGKTRPKLPVEGKQMLVHKPKVPEHMLPTTVDWRGSGADSPVKDQASCGSCWAFGTIGPLETAYFRETGKQLLLSEQNLMDCGWYLNNKACFGGYQDIGLQWLMDRGKVATQEAYPYQGVDNFCTEQGRDHINFDGDFVTTDGSEYALKEAIFTKGPMTVSVDAAPDSFVFYSSGVYNNSACKSDYADLDHAVLVSGYGTTEEGHDYWLVKNTWSALWGDKGYIKIARHPQDCGIATQPMYVDLRLHDSST